MNLQPSQRSNRTPSVPSPGAGAVFGLAARCLLAVGGVAALGAMGSCSGGPGPATAPAPSVGTSSSRVPAPSLPVAEAQPADADLAELRRLAVDAPLAELLQHRLLFMYRLSSEYRADQVLWLGVERLCDAVVAGEPIADRRLFARLLAQVIEHAEASAAAGLRPRIPELRRQT